MNQSSVRIEAAAARVLLFEEVYPARAAQEQAEKSKLNAFGALARLNPLNRPKAETVQLSKWELRYEPFWHVVARREVDYTHDATYVLPVGNPHAQRLDIAGQVYPVLSREKKPHIELPAHERCLRRVDTAIFQDGMKRDMKPAVLQRYVDKYQAADQPQLDRDGLLQPLLSSSAATQLVLSRLGAEAIDASEIHDDTATIEKLHLYYRPVFAFEYVWSPAGKVGVVEVDGLTGEVVELGQWFREKLGAVVTRDLLVDIGADAISMAIPGGSIAVKVINRLV
ncbi:hypothetical protein [Luteimonas kalidii]|uniref:Uncharacterized protein n=1 Tax=Luteimonas kalidii TaxID=3042025 RepID=A0ABT6JTG5_9GAMM|nr:hypothetical protein [Luteimonas kalidii]MDH5833760.1 hypothetical protein [Luteimonas kalidii]